MNNQRLANSVAAAVIVMFVAVAAVFSGWEHGALFWCLMVIGQGLVLLARLLPTSQMVARYLIIVAEVAQCCLLVGVFYSLGSWWERKTS